MAPRDPGSRARRPPDDVPAIRGILAAHGNDGPVTRVDIVGPYVRHLVTRHRTLLTEEDGVAVAFGAVVDAGLAVHLADLFVAAGPAGPGPGPPAARRAVRDAPRRTTFASDDPRALPLYVRAGMTPLWPTLHVEGDASRLAKPPGPGGGRRCPGGAGRAGAGLDGRRPPATITGSGRPRPTPIRSSSLDRDGPVALAIGRARQVSDVRVIDRMRVRPGADPVPPVLAALRRTDRGTRVVASLLGPNPVLPVLLEAGFRVTDRDQYMASDAGLVDPARFLPNPGML